MKLITKQKQAGFTLVELVVVIIILGILAAVALPKFMDVTSKAHKAAVDGAAGGLGAGVALFHAQWVANGHTAAQANVAGFGDGTVDSNTAGWPVDTGGAATLSTAAHCLAVWNGVMQSPPTIATSGTTTDYTASVAATTTTCIYTYNLDNGAARSIQYDSLTGIVSKTNP